MSSPDSTASRRPERPEYGEYATPEEQEAQRGNVPQSVAAPPPLASTVMPGRVPRAGDHLASRLLLVVGAVGTGLAVSAAFGFDEAMASVYLQYGIHETFVPNDGTRAAQYALGASHIALYLIAVIGTGRLLRHGRRAFWFPLSIGVLAAAVYFGIVMAVSVSDPYLLDAFKALMKPGG